MIVLNDFKEPNSEVRFTLPNTKAILDKRELGVGTLYVTESVLSWQGPQGFSIDYPHISVHALSKDPNLYPTDCLYMMIDNHVRLPGEEYVVQDNDDSDNESDNDTSELIFVPENLTELPALYAAIKDCQELNPDSADEVTDEDEAFEDMEEAMFDDLQAAAGDGAGNIQNMQALRIDEHYENGYGAGDLPPMDDDQFEDAD